jgi:SAM-dependent methyltransferase
MLSSEGTKPGTGREKVSSFKLGILMGKAHDGLKPGLELLPEGVAARHGAIPVRSADAKSLPEERIVERRLTGVDGNCREGEAHISTKQVAELVIETLAHAAVRRVYDMAGDCLNGLTDCLRTSRDLQWVHVRHEETAAFAAGAEPTVEEFGDYAAQINGWLAEGALQAKIAATLPTALIDLHEGETVLDLGSGGGIDVLLSAKRVGPTGFAYGLDMTDEMLALAQQNKEKAGATNAAFLKGRIEEIPLPANSVDVVISNCVINLSADKGQVLREAFRVLKPGGRFAVSDVVADGAVPPGLRQNMEAWVGCLAGALEIEEYRRLLTVAGFDDVSVEITRRYTVAEAGLDPAMLPAGWESSDGKLASAFVRATKPLTATRSARPVPVPDAATGTGTGCCGPECCA